MLHDYCMCRDTLCPKRQSCFRYRAVPNGWRQSYYMGPPHDDVTPCENHMDLEGWPDKMIRPLGEEVELSDAEEKAIMARAAMIEAAARRILAATDPVGSLDEVADAAYERAKALLTRGTPHPVLAKLLAPFILAKNVTYSVIWTVAFIVVAPFVLCWQLAGWFGLRRW